MTNTLTEILHTLVANPAVSVDDTPLKDLTTLRLGGAPRATVRCATTDAVVAAVEALDGAGIPVLVVGGGSNLVVADEDLDVVAVVLDCDRIAVDPTTGEVTAEAGAVWDDVVATSITAGFGGLECLSGIPGSAGATPVQNVGAYGVEIADVLTEVELYERATGTRHWVPATDLELSYRYSNLKFSNRAVVLAIKMRLHRDGLSAPLRFGELARALGVDSQGQETRLPAADVREAVLGLRRGKGMVSDATDHDTWSAGSFFTNPIVPAPIAERVQETVGSEVPMPCFDAGQGRKKISAAWLIDKAGFPKGYPGEGAPARLSTKHTLALTNRGQATTGDLVALARAVRAGVYEAFGVLLEPEPVWVGVSIDE